MVMASGAKNCPQCGSHSQIQLIKTNWKFPCSGLQVSNCVKGGCVLCLVLSRVQLFATPWTVARQAPLSMGTLQARMLKWVACPLRGDAPNPGIEPRSPTFQADSLPAELREKPKNTGVGSLSFFRRSYRPRNQTGVSCIIGGFFTS